MLNKQRLHISKLKFHLSYISILRLIVCIIYMFLEKCKTFCKADLEVKVIKYEGYKLVMLPVVE